MTGEGQRSEGASNPSPCGKGDGGETVFTHSRIYPFTRGFNAAMKPSFRTVALIGKYKSRRNRRARCSSSRAFLEKREVKVMIDELTASQIKTERYPELCRSRSWGSGPTSRSSSAATERC